MRLLKLMKGIHRYLLKEQICPSEKKPYKKMMKQAESESKLINA